MFSHFDIHHILDSLDSGSIILDEHRLVRLWSDWLVEYSGVNKEHALNRTLEDIFNCTLNKYLANAIENALKHGRSTFLSPRLHGHPLLLYRYSYKNKKRELINQKIVISSIKDDKDQRLCIININDVTASLQREASLQQQTRRLKEAKEKLVASEKNIRKIAFRDHLTGLANRNLFLDRLKMAMAQSKREKQISSIMLIDIDGFKQVNDSYGHDVGDQLLIKIAKKLRACVRESDTVARLGGDEFAIIQHKMKNTNSATTLARKINESTLQPININNILIKSSSSIGISVYPSDAETATDLLKNADLAMYNVKQNGRSGWQFYSESLRSEEKTRQMDLDALSQALNNNRIVVQYQPEINLANNSIDGFEALARYYDDNNQLVMPNDFIHIAEESGLINDITLSMLKSICDAGYIWQHLNNPKIAINISSLQFYDDDLIKELSSAHSFLKRYNTQFEIEITESVLMENTDCATDTLGALSSQGISIAIDDFGTGYSSLGYLKCFPINKLKIDRSFINDIEKNKQDEIITNTIISLGHNLGLSVLAEGVETQYQQDYLVKRGCDAAQGYYYSKPMDENHILDFNKRIEEAA